MKAFSSTFHRRMFLLISLLFLSFAAAKDARAAEVKVLRFSGIINPIAAEYLGESILLINNENSADVIIVMLDTPGGLDTSMRIIIKEIMASRIPIVVYVAPSGSRAASAGTFITIAAHVAAMAPGTSIGAAHPVSVGGGEMDRNMSKKVENDAASYIASLAKKRGRNAEWAEKAVRKSVSANEEDAIKDNVIDLVAKDLDDLLKAIDGREVETAAGKTTIATSGAVIKEIEMTERQKFLDIISNPTVAYILLMLGFYGLFFELSNPGVLLPGIIGGICLILGFYALQSLPVNYAGILLLILAIILFTAELFVPSFGALTLGGVISMIIGGIMLIDTPADYMKVKVIVIAPLAVTLGLVFFFIVGYAMLFRPKKISIGADGMVGEVGKTISSLDPFGAAEIEGEIWDVRSESGDMDIGNKITVVRKEGHILVVKKAEEMEDKKA